MTVLEGIVDFEGKRIVTAEVDSRELPQIENRRQQKKSLEETFPNLKMGSSHFVNGKFKNLETSMLSFVTVFLSL